MRSHLDIFPVPGEETIGRMADQSGF